MWLIKDYYAAWCIFDIRKCNAFQFLRNHLFQAGMTIKSLSMSESNFLRVLWWLLTVNCFQLLQARIIHELSKRVFHALRTDPGNFELEFLETRRRTGRRPQIEPKGQISSSSLKPATNFRSNSMTANVSSKTVSGATILRRRSQRNPEKPSAASTLTARDNKMLLGKILVNFLIFLLLLCRIENFETSMRF